MTLVNIETGEVAESVTVADVRASIARLIDSYESIWDEWAWQVEHRAWQVLGYASWDEMRAREYGHLSGITAPRAERPELVARFRKAGFTQKETAETLGISQGTVSHYEGSRPTPKPNINFDITQEVADEISGEEVYEAELVEEDDGPERDGKTTWSEQVQTISANIPMEQLNKDELEELLGAVEFLRHYITGELHLRTKGK